MIIKKKSLEVWKKLRTKFRVIISEYKKSIILFIKIMA